MASPQPNAILETIENTISGMHAGLPPQLLSRQHVAFSVNITHRGGQPRTRSALVKRPFVFSDEDTEERATEALWQGASFYEGFGNNANCLVASIGGRLFRYAIGVSTVAVQDISIAGDLNSPVAPQAWLFQGEDFLIINDGLSYPIFFDGAATRRSAGPPGRELPAGAMGTYSNGRIVMALPNRRSFIAGDLVYSLGGAGPYNGRDSILKTNENISILGGAAFSVPINAGRINAMFSVAVPDTSLGQGPLQIGTRKGVFGVDLPLDATQWTTLQQPTQVVSLPSAGPLSHYAVSVVNMDAWYRAKDGIRSFQIGRRDMGSWQQTPLSSEVDEVLRFDTDHLLEYASSVEFDNRYLVTCSPRRVEDRGIAHHGLIALDFSNISSLTTRSNPDYDGLWTGLPILQIVTGDFDGKDRCFVFALDADNRICLYELLKDDMGTTDFDGAESVPIESWLVSNALFGLEMYPEKIKVPLKKLICADLFLEDLSGTVEVDAKFRSDAYPFWNDWKEFSLCATACVTPTDCSQPLPSQFQYATFRRLPEPSDTCNPASGRLHRTGYWFQIRLQWTGHAALDKMLVWSVPMTETIPTCPATEECKILQGCADDYFTYQIEGD